MQHTITISNNKTEMSSRINMILISHIVVGLCEGNIKHDHLSNFVYTWYYYYYLAKWSYPVKLC